VRDLVARRHDAGGQPLALGADDERDVPAASARPAGGPPRGQRDACGRAARRLAHANDGHSNTPHRGRYRLVTARVALPGPSATLPPRRRAPSAGPSERCRVADAPQREAGLGRARPAPSAGRRSPARRVPDPIWRHVGQHVRRHGTPRARSRPPRRALRAPKPVRRAAAIRSSPSANEQPQHCPRQHCDPRACGSP
jgi:hypothetical protein